jgi:hypothetical protein
LIKVRAAAVNTLDEGLMRGAVASERAAQT